MSVQVLTYETLAAFVGATYRCTAGDIEVRQGEGKNIVLLYGKQMQRQICQPGDTVKVGNGNLTVTRAGKGQPQPQAQQGGKKALRRIWKDIDVKKIPITFLSPYDVGSVDQLTYVFPISVNLIIPALETYLSGGRTRHGIKIEYEGEDLVVTGAFYMGGIVTIPRSEVPNPTGNIGPYLVELTRYILTRIREKMITP